MVGKIIAVAAVVAVAIAGIVVVNRHRKSHLLE